MNYNESMPPYSRRPSEIPTTILTAALTAAAVTVAVLFVTGNLKSGPAAVETVEEKDAAKDESRQVPSVLGLTPEVALEVLRARDLRLVVQGRRPDNTVKEGQIAEQDPMAQSEIPMNGAVTVVVSAGAKQTDVPDIIGKPVKEAEEMLTAVGLSVKETDETGQCAPATVCECQPAVGTAVNEGAALKLVIAPALGVPDVVGKYLGKAKEELEKAGLKVGKIRWRSNDYKDGNIVLSQEPVAGTVASPGDEIDLFVNEE